MPETHPTPHAAPDTFLAVRTVLDPAGGGRYKVAVEAAGKQLVLDHHDAVAYAVHVNAAAERAEYDAAVYEQMTKVLELSPEDGVEALMGIRAARRPLNNRSTEPYRFTPGVSAFSGESFVMFEVKGSGLPNAQMAPVDVRQHAVYVLEADARAHDDTIYRRWLIDQCGTDEAVANNTVAALDTDHNPDTTESKED